MADTEDTPTSAALPEGLSNLINLFITHAPVASRISEGQELLKRFNSPELAPSFGDHFFWNHANAQRKQEERARIATTLQSYQKDAFKSQQYAILPAFFRPLKEGEASQLMQAQANSPQAKLAQAFQRRINAPSDETGADPAMPSTYLQAGQGVPPGQDEITSRLGPALAQFLPRIAAMTGNVGQMRQAVEEQRKQQESAAFDRATGPQGAAPQAATAPARQDAVTMTPMRPQTPSTIPAAQQPLATRAQAAGVHPPLALAIVGNEGSGPRAVSPDGATGTWQIMPGTAKPLLLAQGIPVERLNSDAKIQAILKDPAINERAGLMLAKQLQEKYPGRLDLALAEYHGGPGAVLGGPNGTVNPKSADVNMTTTEYVRRGMARMQALGGQQQVSPPTAASTPADAAAYRAQQQQAQTPLSAMVAGPGAPAPQAPEQPYAPAPFPTNPPLAVTSMTRAAGGGVSKTATAPTPEERIPGYVRQEMERGGYRALGPALAEAYRATNLQPRAEQLKELKAEASQLAYQEARQRLTGRLQDPDLHIVALQEAAAKTNGFFSGQDLGALQNPVSLRAAETLAGLQATGQHELSQQGREQRAVKAAEALQQAGPLRATETQAGLETAGRYETGQLGQEQRKMKNAEDVTKAVEQHNALAEATLDEPITDHNQLVHYPGAKSGMTRRELAQLHLAPTSVQSLKDQQAARAALAAIDSMEKAFAATAPPEHAVIPQRLVRGTLGYFTGLEKANERYATRRNFFMQSVAQVVGDQDKRFNAQELKLLDEALPGIFTRKSTAKDAFGEMRRQVKVKFGDVAPVQGTPTQGEAEAEQARERLRKRFAPKGTP